MDLRNTVDVIVTGNMWAEQMFVPKSAGDTDSRLQYSKW